MTDTIPNQALIVVADGGKAILFRNTGSGHAVVLREERRLTPNAETEQGPSGSRPVEQSESQTAEASFVNVIAHALHAMHGQGEFKALVLVAAPATLGELRSAIHKSVAATVACSISKDLTNHTTKEIAEALSHAS